jgi:hypothetical protein
MSTIPLRCRCGKVRGQLRDVSAAGRKHAVCYCDDCQIYASHLDESGALLDERGGTEGVLTTPSELRIDEGASYLRCLRLSPKGIYRWYTECCNTPVGTMVDPRVPVLILPTVSLDFAAAGTTADRALGPVTLRIHGRFARGGVPEGAHPKTPPRMLPALLSHLLRGYLGRKTKPSPFYDARNTPRATPTLIDLTARETLRARVLAAARP